MNKIAVSEVEKHNTKTSSWTIINNEVYDLTNFVDEHPGGDVIKGGIGKDATELYYGFHDDYSLELIKKYKIGEIE